MKRILIPTSILVFIIAVLFAASFLLPWGKYKETIIASIQSATGREVAVGGKVSGSLLPLPHVVITDIRIANMQGTSGSEPMVEAKSLKAQLKILPLLQGKMEIAAITLNKAVIQLEVLENGKKNWDFSDISTDSNKNSIGFSTIELVNSEVVLRKNSSQFLKSFKKVNASIDFTSLSGPFEVEGSFAENRDKISFYAHAGQIVSDKDTDFSWKLDTPYAQLSFEGKMAKKDKGLLTSGKLTANTSDINRSFYKLMGADGYKAGEKKQSLTLTADASFTGKEMSLENLVVDSAAIKGSGRVRTTFDATPVVDVILSFDAIDLDAIQKQGNAAKTPFQPRIKYTEVTFPKNINALLYLTIKKVTYHGKDIQNIVLNTDLFNGAIEIYPSTAQLPDDTRMEISGSITSNGIRPAFDGSLAIAGKKFGDMVNWLEINPYIFPVEKFSAFDIQTGISITPKELRFSSMDFMLDSYNIAGMFNIRHGSGIPEINTNLTFNKLDLDNPLIIEKASELLEPFSNKSTTEPGAEFQWLRKFPMRIGGEITVADLQYNKRSFKNPLFIFHVVPGSIKWDRISVDSELASLDAEAMLDIRALRPQVTLNMKGDRLDMAVFSLPEVKKAPLEAKRPAMQPGGIEPPKEGIPAEAEVAKPKWSNTPFNFIRLDKFGGSIHAILNSFNYEGIPVTSLNTVLRLSDGVVAIESLKAEIFNGKLLAKGGIGITPPSLSCSFSLANGQLEKMLPAVSSVNNLSGYFSLSGSFTMQGVSPFMWASGMESGISVAVRDMKVKNFDLEKIVTSADELKIAEKSSFDQMIQAAGSTGETLFRNVDGKVVVEKGILQVSNLKFDSTRTSGVMSGSIDIGHWILNMISQYAFIPQGSTLTLPIGITLTGGVESPEKKLDVNPIESYMLNKYMPPPSAQPVNQNVAPVNDPNAVWNEMSGSSAAPANVMAPAPQAAAPANVMAPAPQAAPAVDAPAAAPQRAAPVGE